MAEGVSVGGGSGDDVKHGEYFLRCCVQPLVLKLQYSKRGESNFVFRMQDIPGYLLATLPSSVLKLRLTGSGCSLSVWSLLAKIGRGFLGEGGIRSNPSD
jgi:hypothetical protein